jgi:hypothetical protein
MARRLGDDRNLMIFQDKISGTDIGLYYRMPTPSERINYSNEQYQRKGNKIKNNTVKVRLKYGAEILMGFRDGDFERKVDNKWVPIASDEASDNYYQQWFKHLKDHASDLIERLAYEIFEAPVQPADIEDDGGSEEDLDPIE